MKLYNNLHADNYKKLEKLSLFAFLSNLPNFFIVTYSAIVGNTAVVWVDALVSLGETLHTMIVWLVAIGMRKESGDKYNYGMGRLEVFVSLICDIIISIGMFGVMFGAVYSIFYPEIPGSSLILFCIVKVSNASFDLYFLIKQVKICRTHNSKLNQTEKVSYRNALINDVTVGVVALICYIFKEHSFVQYLSPIVSIGLAIWFLTTYIRHVRVSIREISDASLPIKVQDDIYDAVIADLTLVKRVSAVNCHRLNDTTYVDVGVELQPDTTFAQTEQYLADIKARIRQVDDTAIVQLIIAKEDE